MPVLKAFAVVRALPLSSSRGIRFSGMPVGASTDILKAFIAEQDMRIPFLDRSAMRTFYLRHDLPIGHEIRFQVRYQGSFALSPPGFYCIFHEIGGNVHHFSCLWPPAEPPRNALKYLSAFSEFPPVRIDPPQNGPLKSEPCAIMRSPGKQDPFRVWSAYPSRVPGGMPQNANMPRSWTNIDSPPASPRWHFLCS